LGCHTLLWRLSLTGCRSASSKFSVAEYNWLPVKPQKQRIAAYIHVDEQIQSAKLNYGISIGSTFSSLFPHPDAWSLFYQQSMAYLDRVAYLIGVY